MMPTGLRTTLGEHPGRALAALAALGVVLLCLNVPGSPVRSSELELFATLVLPVCLAAGAYVGFGDRVAWWEGVAVAAWGAGWALLGVFVSFFATMESGGEYPGVWVELGRDLARFGAFAASLGAPYGLAGRLRGDHPVAAAGSVLLGGPLAFVALVLVALVL